MTVHRVKIQGPGARGRTVSVHLLRHLLDVTTEASQRVVRLLTEGRSTARGTVPSWLVAATDFRLEILEGSTIVQLEAPSLYEADEEQFSQTKLFPDLDPQKSSLEYLEESLWMALTGDTDNLSFDRGLVKSFRRFREVLDAGAESVRFLNGRELALTRQALSGIKALEVQIPAPRPVRFAGNLDVLRISNRTFGVVSRSGEMIKGVAKKEDVDQLKEMLGQDVVLTGVAHFSTSGKVLRIETKTICEFDEKSEVWTTVPRPLHHKVVGSEVRRAQGPRSGLNAILGRWPGNETDERIEAELELAS